MVNMDEKIKTYAEFKSRLDSAIESLKKLRERDSDPTYNSILTQLEHVAIWTAGGKRPDQGNLNRLSFGMIASRNLDDTNQKLAQELYALAGALYNWPASLVVWTD